MLIHLGSSRLKIMEIEKAVSEVKEGRTERAEVERKIAEARATISELLSHAERLGAMDNGVMDGEEFSGWIVNRTFTGPLDQAEKALHESEAKGKE